MRGPNCKSGGVIIVRHGSRCFCAAVLALVFPWAACGGRLSAGEASAEPPGGGQAASPQDPVDAEVLRKVRQLVGDTLATDNAARETAWSGLGSMGNLAVPGLVALCHQKETTPQMLRSIVIALGDTKDPRAAPALMELLSSKDARMRRDCGAGARRQRQPRSRAGAGETVRERRRRRRCAPVCRRGRGAAGQRAWRWRFWRSWRGRRVPKPARAPCSLWANMAAGVERNRHNRAGAGRHRPRRARRRRRRVAPGGEEGSLGRRWCRLPRTAITRSATRPWRRCGS